MTENQNKKIQNLEVEIRKIEDKIDKLLTHRAMLVDQIEKIKLQTPKEVVKPSEEQRKAQSEKDKAEFVKKSETFRTTIRRLEL